MSYRRCKWLPDRLKEESVEAAHCVEKALLKAVRNLYFESVMIRILNLGFLFLYGIVNWA